MSRESNSESNLSHKALRGVKVVISGQVLRLIITVTTTVILSRLLSPSDFGVMAVLLAIVALAELLRDFGLTTAASRLPIDSQAIKNSLFIINLFGGFLAVPLVYFVVSLLSRIIDFPELGSVVLYILPVFVLNGASAQFRAEINSRLMFTKLTVVDTAPAGIGLLVAVSAAYISPGLYVLVLQQVVVAFFGLVLAVILCDWRPGFTFDFRGIVPYFKFGVSLFGTQLIAYCTKNADTMLLGAAYSPTVVGFYNRAYQLLMVPMNQISAPLTRVFVPYLSRVAQKKRLLTDHFYELSKGMLLTLGTAYLLFSINAELLISILLGPQWDHVVTIFQILAIGGIFRCAMQVYFWVFLAMNKTRDQLVFYTWSQPLIVLTMIGGLPWGATGVAAGHTVGYGLNVVLLSFAAARSCDIPVRVSATAFGLVFSHIYLPGVVVSAGASRFIQGNVSLLFSLYFLLQYFNRFAYI